MPVSNVDALAAVFAQFELAGVDQDFARVIIQTTPEGGLGLPEPERLRKAVLNVIQVFMDNGTGADELLAAVDASKKVRIGIEFDQEWARHQQEMKNRHAAGQPPITAAALEFLELPNGKVKTTDGRTIDLYEYLSSPVEAYEVDIGVLTQAVGCGYLARNLMFMRADGNIEAFYYESSGGEGEGGTDGKPAIDDLLAHLRLKRTDGGEAEVMTVGENLE